MVEPAGGVDPTAAAAIGDAHRLADDLFFPAAQEVDRSDRIPPAHLQALAAHGLFGLAGPAAHGGLDLAPFDARRVIGEIGFGCGATLFVWVQHHGVVRALRASPNEALIGELLPELCAGRLVAGTAFAHVRRSGPPAISATPINGGWRLDGHAPWATSWGIADWFSVAAVSPDGDLVWAMLPGADPEGVVARPLELPVFGATGTVALRFDGCVVPDHRVIAVESLDRWRRRDRRQASIGQPAVLGVVDRAVRLLAELGDGGGGAAEVAEAAERLGRALAARWTVDAEIVAELVAARDDEQAIVAASGHRTECLDLARRATTGLLAAVGGRGMDLDHPAQRLAREADFYVIQAQTADGRAATLRSL